MAGAASDVAAGVEKSRWPGAKVCPTAVVMVARGSGEDPQSPDDPVKVSAYTAETGWGLGGPGTLVAGAIQGELNAAGFTSSRQGLVYPAMAVPKDPRKFDEYMGSIKSGGKALVSELYALLNRGCVNYTEIHLVGYSQGAWALRVGMRMFMDKFNEQGEQMYWLRSITLFGDPTFNSAEKIVRWGKRPLVPDVGIAHAARLTKQVPDWWYAPYHRKFRDRVSSYCLNDDMVCRAPRSWQDLGLQALALKWTRHLGGHLSYGGDEIVAAGDWAAQFFMNPDREAIEFAKGVLAHGEAGNVDALWLKWSMDSDQSPGELVDTMAGEPGRVEHCGPGYSLCVVRFAAHPGVRWYLGLDGLSEDDPEATVVSGFSPIPS